MSVAMAVLFGLVFGTALVFFVLAFFDRGPVEEPDLDWLRSGNYDMDPTPRFTVHPRRLGAALAVGFVFAYVTTWPVFGIALAFAANGAPALFVGDGFKDHVGRTDAIATWIESLRDSMSQARSVEGALRETALAAPEAIADELYQFVDEVDHGVLMSDALVNLSDRLDHAVSDTALAALVMALSEGAAGVQSVLNQVAATCRRMAADSNEVYAMRASSRTTVKMIIGIVVLGTLFFVVAFRDYLEPYGTAQGQLILSLVLLWFAGCGLWIVSLAKYRPAVRMIRPGRLVDSP